MKLLLYTCKSYLQFVKRKVVIASEKATRSVKNLINSRMNQSEAYKKIIAMNAMDRETQARSREEALLGPKELTVTMSILKEVLDPNFDFEKESKISAMAVHSWEPEQLKEETPEDSENLD